MGWGGVKKKKTAVYSRMRNWFLLRTRSRYKIITSAEQLSRLPCAKSRHNKNWTNLLQSTRPGVAKKPKRHGHRYFGDSLSNPQVLSPCRCT